MRDVSDYAMDFGCGSPDPRILPNATMCFVSYGNTYVCVTYGAGSNYPRRTFNHQEAKDCRNSKTFTHCQPLCYYEGGDKEEGEPSMGTKPPGSGGGHLDTHHHYVIIAVGISVAVAVSEIL